MKKTLSLSLFTVFLATLILVANIQGLLYNCFNAVDFGIYLQGIYGLGHGDFNPFLTVRNLKLFTDHFDPINFFPALLMKITTFHPTVLMTFEWLVVMTLAVIVFLIAKRRINFIYSLLLALIVFMNKPMLLSLRFPVHPTTWSIVPLFLLSYFLFQDKVLGVFFSGISLLLFKESYPFALFSLSFFYLIQKRTKVFFLFLITSILSYVLLFKIRPLLLGETYSHSGLLFQNAEQNPISFLISKVVEFKYWDLFKNFLPFWIFIVFYINKEKSKFKLSHPFLGLVFFIAPLFLMQFIANRFDFHYGSTFVALLLPLLLQDPATEYFKNEKKQKWIWLMAGLFLFNAGSEIEKMSAQVFAHKNRQCVISSEKAQSIQKLLSLTGELKNENQIATTGGAFNRVLRPGLLIYQIGGFSLIPTQFDTLLLEVHPKEHSWPLSPEDIQRYLKQCSIYTKTVLLQDSFFYLGLGTYPKSCLQ
ncbi:MAG: hypothetical protein ACOYL6_02660 [Bacteriovoracaceae bacterium]